MFFHPLADVAWRPRRRSLPWSFPCRVNAPGCCVRWAVHAFCYLFCRKRQIPVEGSGLLTQVRAPNKHALLEMALNQSQD